jgi:hypothetical protein
VYEFDAATALANFSECKNSKWYRKNEDGSPLLAVERLKRDVFFPGVQCSEKLSRSALFFTVGSCFAREVERALTRIGVAVLSLPKWDSPGDLGYLNRYNAFSIYNEFAWGLDPEARFPTSAIVKVDEEKALYADLHSHPLLGLHSYEETLSKREQLRELFFSAKSAEVIVITLGLIEAWYDLESESYLNVAPIFGGMKFGADFIRKHSGRFVFRVISFDENMEVLERLYALLEKHLQPHFRVVVTVSPVPLMATFTDRDVVLANTLSKSMLRTCAETWTQLHPERITYFPSYEMAVNSRRDVVYGQDGMHVRHGFVDKIMQHFMNSCVQPPI